MKHALFYDFRVRGDNPPEKEMEARTPITRRSPSAGIAAASLRQARDRPNDSIDTAPIRQALDRPNDSRPKTATTVSGVTVG